MAACLSRSLAASALLGPSVFPACSRAEKKYAQLHQRRPRRSTVVLFAEKRGADQEAKAKNHNNSFYEKPRIVPSGPAYMPVHAQATRAGSFPVLAARNFKRELGGLFDDILRLVPLPLREPLHNMTESSGEESPPDDDEMGEMPESFGFTLDNEAIFQYDLVHPPPGPAPVPAVVQVLYDVLLFFVDRLYEGKAIERFWFLETVARMPYFAYTTCLHLYETMGWYRAEELRRRG